MPSAHPPTGFRRLTLSLLQADRAAACFDGLPDDVDHHGQLLATVKAVAPRIGLSVRLVHALDWLFRFTRPQDWEAGRHPIVWPSATLQQEALGLSATQVKAINRGLIEAGLVTMKDSPNGKRYGHRDKRDRITEAYGFDLSPIAARYTEFVQVAAEAKAEWELIGRLRRRGTIARKAITQILETVAEYDLEDEAWQQLRQDTQALVKATRRIELPDEMTIAVGSLERRQVEAWERLEKWLESVNTAPKGPEYCPHNLPTKSDLESKAVHAREGCNGQSAPDRAPPDATVQRGGQGVATAARAEDPPPRLSIDDLVRVAPRLETYLQKPRPIWPDVVSAADWLRGELGISRSLWGEACITMGREAAAVAVAIVSTKPEGDFRTSPGGYFFGMVRKAKAGELNLERAIWGLRQRSGLGPFKAETAR